MKTLDVKIMELKEEAENIPLLLSVLACVYQDADDLIERETHITDFDLVNYVLANALKAD